MNASVGNAYETGFNSFGTSVSNTITYSSDGFLSSSQNISTNVGFQTGADVYKQRLDRMKSLQEKEKNAMTEKEKEAVQAEMSELYQDIVAMDEYEEARRANENDQQRRAEDNAVATGYEVTRRRDGELAEEAANDFLNDQPDGTALRYGLCPAKSRCRATDILWFANGKRQYDRGF